MEKLDTLIKMADGFMVSKVLFTTVKFGVYTKLSDGEKSIRELSELLSMPERSLAKLLDVCVALGLLNKREAVYYNTPLSQQYLVENTPDYFGYYCHSRNDMLYLEWGKLEHYLQHGKIHTAVEGKDETTVEAVATDKDFSRRAMMAQHNYSQHPSVDFAETVDLADCKTLLDAGGGTGIFSVMAAKKFPNLKAIVFDRPFVLEVAKDIIAEHGVPEQVLLHPGDIMKNPFPEGADVVLMSTILDGYSEEDCQFMINKVYDYLPRGGRLILIEIIINDARSGPLFPALFGLLLKMRTVGGDARTKEEMTRWLSGAGFANIKYEKLGAFSGPYRSTGMLTAFKK